MAFEMSTHIDIWSRPATLSATALQETRSEIQVVVNHEKDTSAEHVHRTLIISMIVRLRTKGHQVKTDSGAVEVDVVLPKRLDVSV
jgi:hypothetical protein